jgi:ATP-dependent RNA helicase HrpA
VSAQPKHPITFPPQLPISACVQEIARAIHDHQVVIVAGETGSGKTTQLPKICLAMGRGLHGRIGCTQPRRIAATSVAARVAEEIGVELGREVGFKIRFTDQTSPDTYIKFVTDGMMLAELQGDPSLRGYDTIIVDEAHERSLNIDFLLGYLKILLPKRPDLRVIISSATLEIDRFSEFFGGVPVVEVSGRTHPVEVVYHPASENVDLAEHVADVVDEITEIDPRNDVLVFLPGEREIHEAMDALTAKALPHTVLLPLYGRLPRNEQLRVFQSMTQRRVVLATNVAETSLTIPGIVFVVDTGVARVNRYNPRNGITQLLVEPISQASGEQRKGRAGRVRSGVCYRLYEEDDFLNRASHTTPEIRRVGLSGVVLQMKTMGLGRVEDFPFLDPPSKRSIDEGYRVLEELGAIDADGNPNELGHKLAKLPLDPRLGRMILAGDREGCLREVTVLAAALSVNDPLIRPLSAQRKADEAHRRFRDETSDFVGRLKLWQWYETEGGRLSGNQLRRLCRDTFVSHQRMREWNDVYRQVVSCCKQLRLAPNPQPAKGEAIHRALLAGLLGHIGMWQPEKRSYIGARQLRFVLHPSSALAKKPPAWVFAAELVETSQSFARMVAVLSPDWVEDVAGPLCKKSYQQPHWEQRPAHVVAKEHLTLFGLPIVRDRRVHYGPIEPKHARELFLLHALVRGEYASKGAFVEHNRGVLEEAKRLRSRARRSDMMVDEDALLPFFDKRVPDGVYSGKTLELWRKTAETEDPGILKLSLADVLQDELHDLSPDAYPDSLALFGTNLPLSYRFEPCEDDDGVTVTIPLVVLFQADPDVLDWTIPAWHREKIERLLRTLPKALRKDIAPIAELAEEIALARRPFEGPMLATLERDVHALTGARIPRDAWRMDELPPHLRFWFSIVDDAGKPVGQGRDLLPLKERFAARAQRTWQNTAKARWERNGLTSWNFGALRERIPVKVAGGEAFAFPALVDEGTSVSLRAMPSLEAANDANRAGLRRLLLLNLGDTANQLERALPSSLPLTALARHVADNAKQLREQLVVRVLNEAFRLDDPADFPRDQKMFQARLVHGRGEVRPLLAATATLTTEIGGALTTVEATLRRLAGKPGAARAALDDAKEQVSALLPNGLFQHTPRHRLEHLPRYLRAIEVRLVRLPNDPRRDADKASQVVPIWKSFLDRGETLRAQGIPQEDLESFRWLLEELRVRLFAPELKTAVPVSPQVVVERWKSLSR